MRSEAWQATLRRKKAFEAELEKMAKPHTIAGFRRRAWLKHQILKLEAELKQHTLPWV